MPTSRTRLSRALALAGLAGAVSLTVSPGAATADPGTHDRDGAGRAVAELRRTVAPYRDVAAAIADGFVPTEHCVASPAGGMGLHYVNPARLQAKADPAKPQILLYGKAADGSVKLLAAEFFAPADGDRPSLFGQPFDGPMPGHGSDMPVHYDLHVWVEKANPAGVFSPWNPNVSC
jgi:hypothetical protein